jgi:hypothetical protein
MYSTYFYNNADTSFSSQVVLIINVHLSRSDLLSGAITQVIDNTSH